jgi:hypothetical protein
VKNKLISIVSIVALCVAQVACTVDQVLADINVGIQIAGALAPAVTLVSPPDAAICGTLMTIATTGLGIIKTDYDQWKASGAQTDLQKLQGALTVLNSNLTAELNAAHIYSPAARTTVTNWVAVITSTTGAIAALLPEFQAAGTVTAKAAVIAKAPVSLTPDGIRARWVAEVCKGETKCSNLVKVHNHSAIVRYSTLGMVN